MEVGLSRKIKYEWLGEVANQVKLEKDSKKLFKTIQEYLVSYNLNGEANRKTANALMRIWVSIPEDNICVRDNALTLLESANDNEKFAIYWCMTLLAFPFFKNIAEIAGRLTSMQGHVTQEQIERRISETYGERSTAIRASQRVVRSMVEWGALRDTTTKGLLMQSEKRKIDRIDVQAWVIESYLNANGNKPLILANINRNYDLFPLSLNINKQNIINYGVFYFETNNYVGDSISLKTYNNK